MRAGERLKIIRMLLGLQQKAFAQWLGLEIDRYRNVEKCLVKVNEDEFKAIGLVLPELLVFVATGKPMSREALMASESLVNTIPSRIMSGMVPDNFDAAMLGE